MEREWDRLKFGVDFGASGLGNIKAGWLAGAAASPEPKQRPTPTFAALSFLLHTPSLGHLSCYCITRFCSDSILRVALSLMHCTAVSTRGRRRA
jgi:hypothetical protein